MNRIAGTVLAAAVGAAGLVIVAPAGPAFACGEQGWASSAIGQPVAAVPGLVEVTGPGAVAVPAGGTGFFGVTVVNRGAGFRGGIELQVRGADPSKLQVPLTVDVAGSRGVVKTWTRLAEEGTPGSRWYAVDGLSFQSGEATTEFRLGVGSVGVGSDAYSSRLQITARARDAAGREVGTTTFDVTVVDAALQVRTTFPAELRRGAGYREFDVKVRNPSTRTYRSVSAILTMTGLGERPTPREAGSLTAADIGLQQLAGGAWHRIAVHPGCDPSPWARLGEPFDLRAGASRTLHLRVRIAESPATAPLVAHYWVSAGVRGNADAAASVDGDVAIRPRHLASRTPPTTPARATDPAVAPDSRPAAPAPVVTDPPTVADPASLPDTGPAIWPLAAGGALLVAGGATLLAVRRRRG